MRSRATRGSILACALVAGSIFAAPALDAADPDVGDLVKDCSDGVVRVSGPTRYRGGVGVLDRICIVITESGSSFVLQDLRLTGAGALATTTPLAGSSDVTVAVLESEMVLAGPVELKSGGAAGDPGVPEADGVVKVWNSYVSGSTVILLASFDWPNGRITIRDSVVEATTGWIDVRASDLAGRDGLIKIDGTRLDASSGDITVRTGTSVSGDDGKLRISDSSIAAGGDVVVDSGRDGRTDVRSSSLTGATVTITTGPGGTCRTASLAPPIACT